MKHTLPTPFDNFTWRETSDNITASSSIISTNPPPFLKQEYQDQSYSDVLGREFPINFTLYINGTSASIVIPRNQYGRKLTTADDKFDLKRRIYEVLNKD